MVRGAWMAAAALAAVLAIGFQSTAQEPDEDALRVGVSGNEPFVVTGGEGFQGIAVEIWQAVAAQAGWRFEFVPFESVPTALEALTQGELDAVVGPVSITAERIDRMRFSLPFYSSSIAILSRTESPTLWQRLAPFFTRSFFVALWVFLSTLAVVGTFIWLVERHAPDSHFPQRAVRGIGSGIWFAIVTMSTVGYGDLAPKTLGGRIVTGAWIVVSLVMATSLIAGIASTLTLSGIDVETISTAEQLSGRAAAVLAGSPGEDFAQRYGARTRAVDTLQQGFDLLTAGAVDAMVFDRPQLQYFLMQSDPAPVGISEIEYERQNYGFALPLDSERVHELNVNLLELQESGVAARIARDWLGDNTE